MKKGLGKGLGALLSVENDERDVKELKLNEIDPNINQPRQDFDEEKLAELAESIKQHGVVQPIIVKKEGNTYKIVAGERRWRASRLAGLETIPVIIREYSEHELIEIGLIENLQRENLNPVEQARAYSRLIEEHNLTQEKIAEAIGKSRSAIANSLRLNKLDDKIKQYLIESKLTEGHARAILSLSGREKQIAAADVIVKRGMNVRDAERYVKAASQKKRKVKKKGMDEDLQIEIKALEDKLKNIMGTKVKLHTDGKQKGKIIIEYYSGEELERILGIFNKIGKR
ncbi:MAG: ParB/RepB/Spo0J family partition protein [Eubacteriales bacterium]|nr:ParB/RepB/Spo0J family partition protein [Eubacteriales bacterium]